MKAALGGFALAVVFVGAASNGVCGQSRLTINLDAVWRFHLGSLPVGYRGQTVLM
jgi:hypothetical protein